MKILIAIVLIFFSGAGCSKTEVEKQRATAEEVSTTYANARWTDEIPFEELTVALSACDQYAAECKHFRKRIQNLSDGFASCTQPSKLCNALGQFLMKYEYMKPFRGGKRLFDMPDDPFFFSLKNEVLDTYAGAAGFRTEMFMEWWERWSVFILVSAFIIIFLISYILFTLYLWKEFRSKVLEEARETAAFAVASLMSSPPYEPSAIVFWIDSPHGRSNMMHMSCDQFEAVDKNLIKRIVKANSVDQKILDALQAKEEVEPLSTDKDVKDFVADNMVVEPKTPSVSDQLAKDLERGLNVPQAPPINPKYRAT